NNNAALINIFEKIPINNHSSKDFDAVHTVINFSFFNEGSIKITRQICIIIALLLLIGLIVKLSVNMYSCIDKIYFMNGY
ncbi:MAG: hypothetical protein ACTHJ4_07595, partial [Candidatus Nucleicultricaceae bacterium]